MFQSFILSFTGIFVALDVIGTLPLYASMTQKMSTRECRKTVNTSMGVAFVVAVVFIFLGQKIFHFLGISVSDFKIAGGLVLLLVSLADLAVGPEAVHKRSAGSTGVVPLAVPLITGPGVLTTLVLQVGTLGYHITLLALVLNYILAWVFLRSSEVVTRILGKDGTVVISKIAALLLAAIAVSMMRSGIFELVREFHLSYSN